MTEYKRFSRWQQIRINQLGFVNNLILGLSIGVIVYITNFLISTNISLSFYQKLFFWIGAILILISILVGISLAIIRLENYRVTARKALKNDKKEKEGMKLLRDKSDCLDKITWILFYFQIGTFLISFLAFVLLFFLEIQHKIT